MTRPRPSDLLLLRTTERVYLFVVGVDQDALQSSTAWYHEAHARALRTAAQARVDVWETDDGFRFVMVAQHRQSQVEGTPSTLPMPTPSVRL